MESIQDILQETENAINEIKDEMMETAENIKNEWVLVLRLTYWSLQFEEQKLYFMMFSSYFNHK